MPCVMRDGGKLASSSASCVLVDDQFAYIPREFADTFFRIDAAPTAAFSGRNAKAANKGKLHYVRIRLFESIAYGAQHPATETVSAC